MMVYLHIFVISYKGVYIVILEGVTIISKSQKASLCDGTAIGSIVAVSYQVSFPMKWLNFLPSVLKISSKNFYDSRYDVQMQVRISDEGI